MCSAGKEEVWVQVDACFDLLVLPAELTWRPPLIWGSPSEGIEDKQVRGFEVNECRHEDLSLVESVVLRCRTAKQIS